jgi:CHASE2 domain-containing sensor protein
MEPRLSPGPMFDRSLRDTMSAISFGCEVIFAAIGATLAWRTHRRETVLMLMLILAFALGYTLFVAKLRYRIPVLPLLFVFAGVGAHAVWKAARAREWGRWSAQQESR